MVGKIILNYLIITTIVYAILYIYRDRTLTKYIDKTESSDIEKVFNKKFVKYIMAWALILVIICPVQELLMFVYHQIKLEMILGNRNAKDFNNAMTNNAYKIFDDIEKNDEKYFLDVDMSGNDIVQ